MAKQINAVLYARFSPRPDADETESIENQVSRMREFCDKKSFAIQSIHEDRDASGSDWERPGIRNAILSLKSGYVLVIESLSRLARDVILQEVYAHQVKERGARIVSITEELKGDSPESEMIRRILGILNDYNRKVQAQLTSSRLKIKQSEGKMITRVDRIPFGYRFLSGTPGEKDCRIEPDETEQQAIATMKEMRADGKSFGAIAAWLESSGVKTRSGSPWCRGSVHGILNRS